MLSTPSSATDSGPSNGRIRRPKTKDDIFTTHNRNTKKRALADMQAHENDDNAMKLRGKEAEMDDASWRRTKRRMEEKARLYGAMKRGDVEDEEGRYAVDFDRKWAEREDKGGINDANGTSSDDDSEEDENTEVVEFLDGYGRLRKGTRTDAERERRRQAMGEKMAAEVDRYAARPSMPTNIIYGDAVQVDAFNPDEPIAAQMEELAKKRDRELTPPEEAHYDAEREVRSKGTGFFQFSKDDEERKRQMQELERQRQETERKRDEKLKMDRKEERKREIEERRKLIREKRGKVQADRFLDDLEIEMAEQTVDAS